MSKTMNRELLGFDIRLSHKDYLDARWDQKTRDGFLLRVETHWPLSVDKFVWPSVFHYPTPIPIPRCFPYGETIEVTPKNFRQKALKLWTQLKQMKTFFLERVSKHELEGIPIAIELVTKEPLQLNEWSPTVAGDVPDECPREWLFAGYDVADRDRISGLSNCGYGDNEVAALRQIWSPRLNEYGLFGSLEDAMEFTKVSDKRVPKHRPFFVYGLYRDPSSL